MKSCWTWFGAKDYWKMTNGELEHEAQQYKIGEYGYATGGISRQIIIDQLLAKDNARHSSLSRIGAAVSIAAALLNLIFMLINILARKG